MTYSYEWSTSSSSRQGRMEQGSPHRMVTLHISSIDLETGAIRWPQVATATPGDA